MRICIPTQDNEGLNAKVYGHFGSAPFFTVFDTEKETVKTIDNTDANHEHGMCHPIGVIGTSSIDVVICQGMGGGAVRKLNEANIRAFRATGSTAAELIKKYKDNELEELTIDNACGHHGGCH
jgi:predicted Fe-Mo cluster-binding NifX family protein